MAPQDARLSTGDGDVAIHGNAGRPTSLDCFAIVARNDATVPHKCKRLYSSDLIAANSR